MQVARNEYSLKLQVNGRRLNRVVIDQRYRAKHPDVSDEVVLELVRELDGKTYEIEAERGEFQYFKVEPVFASERPYRLVLVLCVTEDYLGVINAFRVQRSKRT